MDWVVAFSRRPWGILVGVLLLYVLSFAAFYPSVLTNDDEVAYVNQSRVMLEGHIAVPKTDALTGESVDWRPSTYPVGTAILMMPFVALAGWQGAYVLPCLSLVLAVLITARWLHEEQRSPLFALLIVGFPGCLVMGRVAMSDIPSMAVVSLGMLLFWRGLDRGWGYWLVSGFIAGASSVMRETNVLPFAPFFAGTVVRRETKCWALIVGGLAGVSLRFISAQLAFDDPLFARTAYILDPAGIPARVAIFALGLTVFVPGGLFVALFYRGRRWPELVFTLLFFFVFFSLQKNTTASSELSKRLILDWRYMIPLLPIVVFGMAEVVPRLWQRLLDAGSPERRARLLRAARVLVPVWIAAVACGAVGVHWAHDRWSASQGRIRDEIVRVAGDDSVVVINLKTTRKYLWALDRPFRHINREDVGIEDAQTLLERHEQFYVIFVDRNETQIRRQDVEENEAFIRSLAALEPSLELDRTVSSTERLRIWRVGARSRES